MNQNIQVHLWDTAGQEKYKSITKQYNLSQEEKIKLLLGIIEGLMAL